MICAAAARGGVGTAAGVKELAAAKQLSQLGLALTALGDEGVKDLAALAQVKALNLGGTRITDAGLKALAALKQLEALGLSRTDSSIPSNFSFYDHVLDAAVTFGAVPSRFADLREADGSVALGGYSTIARGERKRS